MCKIVKVEGVSALLVEIEVGLVRLVAMHEIVELRIETLKPDTDLLEYLVVVTHSAGGRERAPLAPVRL